MVLAFKIKSILYLDNILYDSIIKTAVSIVVIILAILFNNKYNKVNYIGLNLKKIRFRWRNIIVFIFPLLVVLVTFKIESLQLGSPGNILLIVIATSFAASAEEFIFRFFASNYLLNRGFAIRRAAIITSIFFGLAHITNMFEANAVSVINQVILALLAGVVLFAAAFLFNSLFISMLLHSIVNIPSQLHIFLENENNGVELLTLSKSLVTILTTQLIFLPIYILAWVLFKRLNEYLLKNVYQ